MKKIKYLIERYKEAKKWNSYQTGGSKKKSMFYDEIGALLGCRDIVTLTNVSILLRENVLFFLMQQERKGHFPQRVMTDVAVSQRRFGTANFRSATKTKNWKFKNVCQKI